MVDYSARIKELEDELRKTKYNKRTQMHIGLLKAKIAALKERSVARQKGKGKTYSYDVRKTGDGTVIMIGFPSVGKSTLLNALTNAESKTAGYAFTTLKVIPGLLEYNHAKIQLLDVPGIVQGAADGTGRGKEVLSVSRGADLVLILIDAMHPKHYDVILKELHKTDLRINREKPDVKIIKTSKGGIRIGSTVKLKKISVNTIKAIMNELRITNADITIRQDISDDELIDVIEGNKIYVPSLTVLNKIDAVPEATLKKLVKDLKPDLLISAEKRINLEELKELIFRKLRLIRLYLKEPKQKPDMDEPLIMFENATIGDVCNKLHRDFYDKFRFARVWGSSKFDGQMIVKKEYVLKDNDILELHIR